MSLGKVTRWAACAVLLVAYLGQKSLIMLSSKTAAVGSNYVLLLASAKGSSLGMRVALRCGASPNFFMPNLSLNDTVLMLAASHAHDGPVSLLLEAGADPNVKDAKGRTALMMASFENYRSTAARFVEAGANLNVRDNDGLTALLASILKNNTDTVALLVDAGADLNIQENHGYNALMLTARYNLPTIAAALLADTRRVELDAKFSNGQTALMIAAFEGHREVVALLVSAGANLNATDNNGNRAVMWAVAQGHEDTVALLIHAGAEGPATA